MAEDTTYEDGHFAKYDWAVTALDVDCHGKCAALATKKNIQLVDLERPNDATARRKLKRDSKWETHTVRWNPHSELDHVLLTSLNFKIEVWRTEGSDLGTRQLLRAHTLRVSDLCWSPTEPNLFASCSMDAYVYIWDLRDARKPCVAMKTIAGSSNVKWNSFNDNILASAHDMDVRLWDRRKPQNATQYISAHLKQIHGMDWSPTVPHRLSTCSLDGRVQIWNTEQPRISQPACTINIGAPIWRAKFTPFGYGMVTALRPQLHGDNEHSLQLWNLNDTTTPVQTYSGHTDAAVDFAWQTESLDDYQSHSIICASKDLTLRRWTINEETQRVCSLNDSNSPVKYSSSFSSLPPSAQQSVGHDPLHDDGRSLSGTGSNHDLGMALGMDTMGHTAPLTAADVNSSTALVFSKAHTLAQEFSLFNPRLEGLLVEKMDPVQRICSVAVSVASQYAQLTITFPAVYPNDATPSFHFSESSTIDNSVKSQLIGVLMNTAKVHVKHNRPCLEPCLRELVTHMGAKRPMSNTSRGPNFRVAVPTANSYGNTLDDHVPFPRTSGARFCGNGYLVIFKRPETLKAPQGMVTPRSLADLALSCSLRFGPKGTQLRHAAITSHYRLNLDLGESVVRPVPIYEAAYLLRLHKSLATSSKLMSDVKKMCTHNGNAAMAEGREDLRRAWQLMQSVADDMMAGSKKKKKKNDPTRQLGTPWPFHPFGRQLASSLLQHYSQLNDMQAVAMLACACFSWAKFSSPPPPPPPLAPTRSMPAPALPNSKDRVRAHSSAVARSDHSATGPGATSALSVQNSSHTASGGGVGAGASPGHKRITTAFSSFQQSMSLALPDSIMGGKTGAAGVEPSLAHSYSLPSDLTSPSMYDSTSDDERLSLFLNSSLLDTDIVDRCLQCCWWYAEVLHRWELFEQRAELLQCIGAITTQATNDRLVLKTRCMPCNSISASIRCSSCQKVNFKCAVCHIPVKGLSNFCLNCCHGGHWDHMTKWFETSQVCPTGCGCECMAMLG